MLWMIEFWWKSFFIFEINHLKECRGKGLEMFLNKCHSFFKEKSIKSKMKKKERSERARKTVKEVFTLIFIVLKHKKMRRSWIEILSWEKISILFVVDKVSDRAIVSSDAKGLIKEICVKPSWSNICKKMAKDKAKIDVFPDQFRNKTGFFYCSISTIIRSLNCFFWSFYCSYHRGSVHFIVLWWTPIPTGKTWFFFFPHRIITWYKKLEDYFDLEERPFPFLSQLHQFALIVSCWIDWFYE